MIQNKFLGDKGCHTPLIFPQKHSPDGLPVERDGRDGEWEGGTHDGLRYFLDFRFNLLKVPTPYPRIETLRGEL